MKRLATALATATALTLAAPVAFAATTLEFDNVETMAAVNGSEVFSSDGKLVGTLTDVELDGDTAEFIVEIANSSSLEAEQVIFTVEEGKVLFGDDRLTLQATEVELDVAMNDNRGSNGFARILLAD